MLLAGPSHAEDERFEVVRDSAKQKNPDARFSLGVFYDRGDGVPEDDTEAVLWYRRAADQGHIGTQFHLGMKYHSGEAVSEDDVEHVH